MLVQNWAELIIQKSHKWIPLAFSSMRLRWCSYRVRSFAMWLERMKVGATSYILQKHLIYTRSYIAKQAEGFLSKGEGREYLGTWYITAKFNCKGREVGPMGLLGYGCLENIGAKKWQSFPDKALLQHTSFAQMACFLTMPCLGCVRAAGLGFRMNHLQSQPKQGHFVGMQNKPLKTQSIWSPLLNVLSGKAAIP